MASADLPEDRIVKEILIRVPVKSMVRFRCVCKLWNSLVSNPDFTRSQSNLSVSNNFDDDHIILNKRLPDSNLSIISRATLSETRINKVPYPAAIHADMHLVGSINGLVCVVCLSSLGYYFIIWNPATQISKKILLLKKSWWPFKLEKDLWPCLLGFAWDHISNDYKLIFDTMLSLSAVAYSCKTDSWSNVAVRWTRYWKDARWSPSVIVKGIPYWNQSDEIIKFDAKINEFTYFSVPKRHVHYTLIDLNGCLGWIGYIRLGQYAFQLPDVYCFDEKNRIWSKRYIINIIACLSCEPLSYPICFKYGGEIIFDERNILYDLKSGEIKRLCDPSVYLNGFSYTPSFLSLEGMEPFQEEALEDWVVSKYQITFVMKRLLESYCISTLFFLFCSFCSVLYFWN
ncbi:F-box/kelch-repeat protein At3g23880-like [Apium graveolens]|uniref:F-box/kelch-repeat protein At3g23880-like n=1 Tax=Apium graveolens TaxID=4045 RepID=UPI003D7A7A7B